ncbi:uncharacterized protein BP5553_02134 [Venustampulla echinocandica]|uniref:Protein kinase domain-containing protein n=1 Tax=Venustampulla echinocandica TaxID=2656787 RepID=A0A370U307_9HELO|nr:uncharacterized protein BP5553_02134 [Venustampulla echinocandica]RDL42155.1 hypothetical protein BP5553_02134 [Venustampulla echinocandica]
MTLRAGKIIRGASGTYKLLDALKSLTIYKAQVLSGPRMNARWYVSITMLELPMSYSNQRAVVKTAVAELENAALKREYNNYKIPDIASSPYIRTLYNALGSFEEDVRQCDAAAEDPLCLVFECLETDLQSLSSHQYRRDSRLPKIISKSVLYSTASSVVHMGLKRLDVNPNNVFLSRIDGPSPIIKLGDLGLMVKEGYNSQRLHCLPCRAPVVWQGIGCFHSSDTNREVGTLTPRESYFGASDKIVEDHTEAWCIAKLQSLVGSLGICIDYQPYKSEFELAEQLTSMEIGPGLGKLIKVGTLRQELQSLSDPSVSTRLLDFIDYLLVIDMAKRPTAREALQNPYLQYV